MQRNAEAHWQGSLKEGQGSLSIGSGALNQARYDFDDRFAEGRGTNPEELVAAAHAGCFSMALSGVLERSGRKPESIDAKATVSLDREDGTWSVTSVHLDVTGKVPGMDPDDFTKSAEEAKANCPISRLLKAPITLEAKLSS